MFDWANYLELANDWASQHGEGFKRSAISRAYYSVFCSAKNYLQTKNISYAGSNNSHEMVWRTFERLGRSGAKIAIDGERLKLKRVSADYSNKFNGNLDSETNLALLRAKKISRLLDELK